MPDRGLTFKGKTYFCTKWRKDRWTECWRVPFMDKDSLGVHAALDFKLYQVKPIWRKLYTGEYVMADFIIKEIQQEIFPTSQNYC